MKIYFAHPLNVYDTPLEQELRLLVAIKLGCDISCVEDPNQPHHQQGYTEFSKRQKLRDKSHGGMSYFYEKVLPECNACASLPYLDGRMGLGVAGETKNFVQRDLPVLIFQYNESSNTFQLELITVEETSLLLSDDPKLVIPHEETRLRTFKVYGKEKRPYHEAHLVKMPIPAGFYPDE